MHQSIHHEETLLERNTCNPTTNVTIIWNRIKEFSIVYLASFQCNKYSIVSKLQKAVDLWLLVRC